VDLELTVLDPERSAAGPGLLTLGTEPTAVDLNQYQWVQPSKGRERVGHCCRTCKVQGRLTIFLAKL
jgi:hypothetical protein